MKLTSKVLPIKYPIITSYPWHAGHLAILSAYDHCSPWIFSHYIQLKGSLKKLKARASQGLDFLFFDYEYSSAIPWFRPLSQKLNKNTMHMILKKYTLSDFIIDNIKDNFYVSFHLDDFYLKETNMYKTYHIHHENMIYGYNRHDKTFNICGFYKDHSFSFSKISFKDLETAFNHSKDHPIKLLKLRDDIQWVLDIDIIKEFLNDYVLSLDSSRKMGIYSEPFYYEKIFTWGMDNYENIYQYITHMETMKEADIDIRPFHLLWDHKKYMTELCHFLNESNHLNDAGHIIESYNAIEKTALALRNKIIKFMISGEWKLIKRLYLQLERIATEEEKLIHHIINNIKT